jgi:hypothetical protein
MSHQTTRTFKIDDSVTVKAYYYQFKNHIECLELVRQNGRGVFDKGLYELLPSDTYKQLLSAAKYLIQDTMAASVTTDCGLTLERA